MDLNTEFLKEEINMAKKYLKRSSIALEVREIQIKTSLRFVLPQTEWPRSRKQLATNAGENTG